MMNDDPFRSALTFLLAQFLGLSVAVFLGRSLTGLTVSRALGYYIFHGFTTFLFYLFCITNVSDSTQYFADATVLHSWTSTYGFDKDFVMFLEYPLIHFLGFTFFSIFYIFGLFGYVGTLLIYSAGCEQVMLMPDPERGRRVALILLLLPAHAFWTSVLGKDSIIMLGIGMVIFGVSRFGSRLPFLMIGLAIAFHARPWIGAVLICSLGAAFLLSSRVNPALRIFFALCIAGVMVALLPVVGGAVGLAGQSSGIEEVGDELDKRHGYYTGGSAVDLQSSGVLFSAFTYLFRPLFIDATSKFALLASFENVFYLGIFTLTLLNPRFWGFLMIGRSLFKSFLMVYFVVGTSLLSYATTNLGIAMRQKTMVMVAALMLFAVFYASRRPPHATRELLDDDAAQNAPDAA